MFLCISSCTEWTEYFQTVFVQMTLKPTPNNMMIPLNVKISIFWTVDLNSFSQGHLISEHLVGSDCCCFDQTVTQWGHFHFVALTYTQWMSRWFVGKQLYVSSENQLPLFYVSIFNIFSEYLKVGYMSKESHIYELYNALQWLSQASLIPLLTTLHILALYKPQLVWLFFLNERVNFGIKHVISNSISASGAVDGLKRGRTLRWIQPLPTSNDSPPAYFRQNF